MAIRLTGTFQNPEVSLNSDVYTVDIYDADHVGASYAITIISATILYEASTDNDLYSPIVGSRCSITLNVPATDSALTDFIEDFAYGEEGRFTVNITKDSSPTTVWRGILVPDQSGEEDIDPFHFKLSGVCGLATLKKTPYHDGAAIYTGIERLSQHLIVALTKMAHTADFWTGSDVFLRTAIDWWAADMSSGANDDALYQAGVWHSAFWDYKTQGGLDKDVLSSYDVVSEIMLVLGCRIYQSEGHWRIDQVPYRSTSPYTARDYTVAGAFISSSTQSGANVIDNTRAGAKIKLINYDFLPILKKASVLYQNKMRRNLLQAYPFYSTNQKVDDAGGTAVIRLRFTVNYKISNDFYSGSPDDLLYIIPSAEVKIGDYYLKRGYSISNFTANLEATQWIDTPASDNLVYAPIFLGKIPVAPFSVSGSYTVDVMTIPLPESGETLSFVPHLEDMAKWDGTFVDFSEFTISFSVSNVSMEAYDNGTPSVTEDEIEFSATNPDDAKETYEKKLRLGSAVAGNGEGRLWRWNGSAWVIATLWGQGVETRDDFISDILAKNILNAHNGGRRRMNGTLFGIFKLHHLVQTTDGRKWMMSRVEWDLADRTMSGSWIELDYGATAVSATPIKKYLVPGGGTTTDPTGSTSQGVTTSVVGFAQNPAPAVLAPVSYNALDGVIDEGDTVTSIPIKIASEGSEFLAGDSVILVNPFTGQFQAFAIATAPVSGDLALSVTSEAALYDFPEDSFLVVSQKPYSFTPGNWYTHKGTISANKVIVSGFDLPTNDDACFAVVRRQIYQSPDDFTIDYGDNSINFASGLGLNGQIAYVKAYA